MLPAAGIADRPDGRPRRAARLTFRVTLGTLAAGLLAVLASSLDLAGGDASRGNVVDVEDDLDPAEASLSEAEVAQLRAAADPNRLRCEPRGCELWRLPTRGVLRGIAPLDDTSLLVLDRGTEPDPALMSPSVHSRVRGVDAADGTVRWTRTLAELVVGGEHMDTGAQTRVIGAPDGVLVVTGRSVTSITPDGEARWTWQVPDIDARVGRAIGDERAVLIMHSVRSQQDSGATTTLTALDPATGRTRWNVVSGGVRYLDDDLLVTLEEGAVRSLDPATGEARWSLDAQGEEELRMAGPWLAIDGFVRTRLVDAADGTLVAELDGAIAGPIRHTEDRVLIVLRRSRADREASEASSPLQLLALDETGSTTWSTPVAEADVGPMCCRLAVDDDVVRVTTPTGLARFDLSTGTRQEREQRSDADGDLTTGTREWQLGEDVRVERDPSEPGHTTLRTGTGEVALRGELSGVSPLPELGLVVLQGPHTAMAVPTHPG